MIGNTMTREISKVFDFARVEEDVTKKWLETDSFSTTPDERDNRYVVMMPLPNVTGAFIWATQWIMLCRIYSFDGIEWPRQHPVAAWH